MHPKSFVGRAVPGPGAGAYSTPSHPLAGFKGPTSNGGEGWGAEEAGRGEEGREGREGICQINVKLLPTCLICHKS